ncbi:MAG TPA: RtcB family protein [Longimicrobiales bacterium]|nr:RtcB family protein [Longimicrobiales bacterium]
MSRAVLQAPAESAIRRVDETQVEISTDAREGMRVPARVFADETLWKQIVRDRTLAQLVNVATLPGVERAVYAMPDAHEGYGFPVGGVAAFRTSDGVISPGGVGYDINCGVRLLASELTAEELGERLEPLVHELSRSIPSGAGRGGRLRLDDDDLDRVYVDGCAWLLERGMATLHDLEHTESGGRLPGADPDAVSKRARDRGRDQLGTMGAGNHFVEVERVHEIYDEKAAEALGLRQDQVCILVHTGSRGLGHQVCTDWVARMDRAMAAHGIEIPDRQLACAPFDSDEGRAYFGAMNAAANFAWCNRQVITHQARAAFRRVVGPDAALRLVYDVAHNVAKVEHYDGSAVCVHRKGATRAFGPDHPETPAAYRGVGQPVFIPGSMGTGSCVLVGQTAAERHSFGSACHGAGRRMSRGEARRTRPGTEVRDELRRRGIVLRVPSMKELAEEAPYAYKELDQVVDVVHRAGLARKVARLAPMGVVKG